MSGARTPHTPQPTNTSFSLERHVQERTIYSWILTGCNADRNTHRPFVRPCPSLLYIRSREKIPPSWGVQKWVVNWDMSGNTLTPFHRCIYTCIAFCSPLFSLLSCRSREKTIHTPLYPLSGKSRNEWQIEIWVANHFKILSSYYTWSLSWTIYYYLTMQNNPVGETNNSTSSIALDDPSSISTKVLCIFVHTIIPTSFLILISYNAHLNLSNATTMTRKKRILIWLLINFLIKLTN